MKVPVFQASAEFERMHVRPRPGRTLIVGSRLYPNRIDRRQLYENAVGVDMLAGPGVDRVLNLEDVPPLELGKFDHVDCISVLEHSPRPWLVAASILQLLRPAGTLHVTAPFVWRVHGYPSDFYRFTVEGIRALFSPAIEWSSLIFGNDRLEADLGGMGDRNKAGFRTFLRTEVFGFGRRA